MKFCSRCVMPSTRPRITFKNGMCSACWHDYIKKNKTDWGRRRIELEELLDQHRSKDGRHDVIVPASGGKDSAYVALQLKHKWGMTPLLVTFGTNGSPTRIGVENLENLIASGYDSILVKPNEKVRRKLVKNALIRFGDVFLPFIYGQNAVPAQIAIKFNIPLIMYGENGEVEYGGETRLSNTPFLDEEQVKRCYRSNLNIEECKDELMDRSDLQFYQFPFDKIDKFKFAYWSYFEDWQPHKHFMVAQEKCGFAPRRMPSEGTYTDYASLDDKLDGLHYYFMFLKFGFGRATSDACHEIRENLITREEAVGFVDKWDDEFPTEYLWTALDYMNLSHKEYLGLVDKYANKDLLTKQLFGWQLKEEFRDERLCPSNG